MGGRNEETESVTAVDVNNDGRIDIVASNRNRPNKIYLNLGNNEFGPAVLLGLETDDTQLIKVADVGGNTLLDFVVANRGAADKIYITSAVSPSSITTGAATEVGALSAGGRADDTRDLVLLDINADTYLDVVAANSLTSNKVCCLQHMQARTCAMF